MKAAIAIPISVILLLFLAACASSQTGQVSIYGNILNRTGSPISATITAGSASNSTVSNGNYFLKVSPGTYSINYSIPNIWVSLSSVNLISEAKNLVNYVSSIGNRTYFTLSYDNNQTVQVNSSKKPSKVTVNGSLLTEVFSFSNLASSTWFYDSAAKKVSIRTASHANCPSLSYPSDRWQRVWYDYNTSSCLGSGPDETNVQFDNDWGTASLAYGMSDYVMFRSSRTINVPTSGTYTFTVGSDDGIRLWIDDSLLIDQWVQRPYDTDTASAYLTAGSHRFRIDYYDSWINARLTFSYTSLFDTGSCDSACKSQGFASGTCESGGTATGSALHVDGNQIKDYAGNVIYLRGINQPDFANNADGSANKLELWTDSNARQEISTIKSWGANTIRLHLAVDLWKYDMIDSFSAIHNRDAIKRYITFAGEQGMYVIIDTYTLKSSKSVIDQGIGTPENPYSFQDPLPYPPYQLTPGGSSIIASQQEFIDLWVSFANELKGYPNVIFELWNEPQGSPEVLSEWLDVSQRLIDAIRAAGSQNLILVSGNDFGSAWVDLDGPYTHDMSWVFDHPLTGGNIVYSVHLYGGIQMKRSESLAYQQADVDNGLRIMRYYDVAAQYPLIVGEISPRMDLNVANELTFFQNALDLFNQHGISYTAWGWWNTTRYMLLETEIPITPSQSGLVLQSALASSPSPPTNACKSSETSIGQDWCSPLTCCCSGLSIRGADVTTNTLTPGANNYQPNGWQVLKDLNINLIRLLVGIEDNVAHMNINYDADWAQNLDAFLAQADANGIKVIFYEMGSPWGPNLLLGILRYPSDNPRLGQAYDPWNGSTVIGTPVSEAKAMIDKLAGDNSLDHNFITDPRIYGWSVSNEQDLSRPGALDWNIQMLDYIRSKGGKAWVAAPYSPDVGYWDATKIESVLGSHVDKIEQHNYGEWEFVHYFNRGTSSYGQWDSFYDYMKSSFQSMLITSFSRDDVFLGEFGMWQGYGTNEGLTEGVTFTSQDRLRYYTDVLNAARDAGLENICFHFMFSETTLVPDYGIVRDPAAGYGYWDDALASVIRSGYGGG